MNTNIFIVESRAKVQTISKILGKNWRVIATNGHICHFEDFNFEEIPLLSPLPSTELQNLSCLMKYFKPLHKNSFFNEFKSILSNGYNNIYIGTDADREGEMIAFSIIHYFKLTKYYRCTFNEINSSILTSITRSTERPSYFYTELVHSALTRTILDYSIGFLISPFIGKHISSFKGEGLSAGRCQTVALRLIYDKETEDKVKNNLNQPADTASMTKYNITGHFFDIPFKLVKPSTNNEFTKDVVMRFLDNPQFTWGSMSERITTDPPPIPYNTSQLIIKAHSILSYSPRYTMERAQALFTKGKITYIRTESTLISSQFIQQTTDYIKKTYGEGYTATEFTNITNVITTNEEQSLPHEAIRPTNIYDIPTIGDDPLYRIIWENTVQACMLPATFRTFDITVNTNIEGLTFKKTVDNPLFKGWLKVYSPVKADIEPLPPNKLLYLRSLTNNSKVTCKRIDAEITVHTPNKHYTESGIIKKLEEMKIGRPSTYSHFTEVLISRGYVKKQDIEGITVNCENYTISFVESVTPVLITKNETRTFGKEKGKLVIQPLGTACIEFLIQHFGELFRYDYTADMEKQLDLIAETGTNPDVTLWINTIKSFYTNIKELTSAVPKIGKFKYSIDEFNDYVFVNNEPCIRRKMPVSKTPPTAEPLPEITPFIGTNGETTKKPAGDDPPPKKKEKKPKKEKPTKYEYEYYPIKKSLNFNIEDLKEGHYSLEDLLEYPNTILGEYKNSPLKIKTGQYGHYLEWGIEPNIQTKSLKTFDSSLFYLDEEQAIDFIEDKMRELENVMDDKRIFRILDLFTSIRQSKYGTYIYHKTEEMKKPVFISLKKCRLDFMNVPTEEIMKWMYEKMSMKSEPKKTFWKHRR
jgi:DNA topoisomerase-1